MKSEILQEVREAALEVRRAEQTWRDCLEQRDRLLVEIYGHYPLPQIAAAALLNKPRVIQVVSRDG